MNQVHKASCRKRFTKCIMWNMSWIMCYADYTMQNVLCDVSCNMCCVEHLNYTSFIEFWYIFWWMNTTSFNISSATLANFLKKKKTFYVSYMPFNRSSADHLRKFLCFFSEWLSSRACNNLVCVCLNWFLKLKLRNISHDEIIMLPYTNSLTFCL